MPRLDGGVRKWGEREEGSELTITDGDDVVDDFHWGRTVHFFIEDVHGISESGKGDEWGVGCGGIGGCTHGRGGWQVLGGGGWAACVGSQTARRTGWRGQDIIAEVTKSVGNRAQAHGLHKQPPPL